MLWVQTETKSESTLNQLVHRSEVSTDAGGQRLKEKEGKDWTE